MLLGALYLGTYLRILAPSQGHGHPLLGPTGWGLAAAGVVLGRAYGKHWAVLAGGALAALGVVALVTDASDAGKTK